MTAPSPHRPSCRCGGTGLVDGPHYTADRLGGRVYRMVVPCPGQAWPTPAPTPARAREVGPAGVAAARAVLAELSDEEQRGLL